MRLINSVFACLALVLTAPFLASQAPSSESISQSVDGNHWSSIRAAYEASRHAAGAVDGGHQARNPGQQFLTRFDGRGFSTESDAGGWTWGLQLERYGFSGHEREVAGLARVSAAGARVAYDWDATLQEWFVNDACGLEHGFTLSQRPPQDREGSLLFTLAVRGALSARIEADGQGVGFVNDAGVTLLTYAGLKVIDADGQRLPARLDAGADGLVIAIDERGARYPVTIDPIVQQAYLKASNAFQGDKFGVAVAISGDTVVVGADVEASGATGVNGNQSDNSAPSSGAVYVFVRSGANWTQQAYLKASNTTAGDHFGAAVSITGNTLVVGAPFRTDGGISDCGSAYVFVRSGTTWSQQAYLTASNRGDGDHFGSEVSVSDDTLVVGAANEDSNGTGVNGQQSNDSAPEAGAAYVFARSGTVWSQQAYLKASNAAAGDSFGASVSASGATLVIGATSEDSSATGVNGDQLSNGAPTSGAAYVFVRNGVTWSQQAYLKPSNTALLGIFGKSASVSNDTAVIGSYGVGTAAGTPGIGAAYVFVRSGTTWSQQAYLQASNAEMHDQFGWDVAASGEAVVVGAHTEDSYAPGVDGASADNSFPDAGAAYVFVRAGATWSQRAYLKASYPGAGDQFGEVVALSDGFVVIGAPWEDSSSQGVNGNQSNDNATDAGAAYISDLKLPALKFATGTNGSLSSQSFDGTRGVDATVLATQNLNVTSITLAGLVPGALSTVHVSARIYSSGSGSLIAASDEVESEVEGDISVPITAILKPGISYRIAFHVDSTGFFNATAALFDPVPSGAAGFPYNPTGGLLRINSAHNHPADAYPVTSSQYVPQITVNATVGDHHWSALEGGLVGAFGLPTLTGSGPLLVGSSNKLELISAKPLTTAALFFGTSWVNAQFKGGVLVPAPQMTIVLTTNSAGSVTLPFVLPTALPAATPLYFQYWIPDAAAVAGFSSSKGLMGLTP